MGNMQKKRRGKRREGREERGEKIEEDSIIYLYLRFSSASHYTLAPAIQRFLHIFQKRGRGRGRGRGREGEGSVSLEGLRKVLGILEGEESVEGGEEGEGRGVLVGWVVLEVFKF
jgi:hypothetical protein